MAQTNNPRITPSTVMILTTAQWNDKSNANIVIPFGCFCVEIISSDLSAKLKVGNGNKHYKELPYIAGGGSMDDYYTKEEIDAIISNLPYMGIVATGVYPSPSSLPPTGNKLGDVRFVKNTKDPSSPIPYLWNGNKWIPFADTTDIDLSAYAKKSEVNPRLDVLESEAHTHANKDILDQVNSNVIRYAHTHGNKQTLDRLTPEVIDNSHTHENKSVLDEITAPFTEEEKTKLASLQNYEPFIGTDGTYDGDEGLVPAPTADDAGKFLSADGTWKNADSGDIPPATTTTIGGVIVGDGLSITEEGVLSSDVQEIPIATDETLGGVIVGDRLSITEEGVLSADIQETPIATRSSLGVVQVGDGLSIDNEGVLSVDSVDVGVTDVQLSEETPGAITVTRNEFSYDIDPFAALGQIWFLCNNNPMVDPPTPPEPELTQPIGHTIPLNENGIVTNVMGHMTIPSS